MIALNETNEYAAEVPVQLPLATNPLVGKTGIAWHNTGAGRTDEFQYRLPTDVSWQNAVIAKIVEKGFGMYALRLAAGECVNAGVVSVRAKLLDGSAQPCSAVEYISQLGGDIPVNGDGYVMFYLANAADPIFGNPLDTHTFTGGEVVVCLPDSTFANAVVADIKNFGNGSYGLLLRGADGATALAGKVYVHAEVAGAQPVNAIATVLGVGAAVPIVPTPPPVVQPNSSSVAAAASMVKVTDHVALGISRLPEQFKFKKVV